MSEGKVLGIGGVFLRSAEPEALAAWYREHLGFTVTAAGQPDPEGNWSWQQAAGATEWDHPDVGRFARIHDPDGNPIELWEPPAD